MRSSQPSRITVVSASVGAGHDGAARELVRRLEAAGFEAECHDFLDLLPPGCGRLLRASYALELKVAPWAWGWLLGGLEKNRSSSGMVGSLFARAAARRTRKLVGAGTAAVVSTYPLASQALGRLRRRGEVEVPVTTFLTDMSVHPLWVAEGVDLHLALDPVAAAQAARHGATDIEICQPLVGPKFRPARSAAEVAHERARFGLPVDQPVALITAGSWGVGEVEQTAREIAAAGVAVPVTVCGHNTALRDKLTAAGTGIALGWVEDMPALIRASDVVVQNAGGLTSLEAMASGVPVVSYRCLPGHGVTNAAALDEAGLAVWIRDEKKLAPALTEAMTGPARHWRRSAPAADHVIAELAGAQAPAAPVLEVAS
ncbi:MGDG synthase family glycosyltransferase [Kitasatospora viridis]|uniref:UDP-N-acetylglucosamine:LPS N-acetylglucosamine transferase n=1 Tax=Kitasatospora viridis TaxID=281105 RepID=A0A561UBG1_9ACTN|nr:glycosyltransferase [Kitasatospora viridis]TWF96694.1 UDP-N-acetylglucosamine:LPS N-acetylglucosamine transferase [Kitasatospora viridis]